MSAALLRFSPFVVAGLLLAVMFHILIVLALPDVARRTAGQIMQRHASEAGFRVLPATRSGAQALPFADPAFVMAACRFDLSDGPFQIRAATGETFLSLVVVAPNGAVQHALSDKAAVRRVLDVVLATQSQIRALEAQDPEDEPVQELRLRLAIPSGTVLLKVFAPRTTDAEAARELLGRAQCRPLLER